MSQGDLLNAYVDGRLSRRTLIRRLVAGGLSFGAAVSYAHLLGQERAQAAGDVPDHYGFIDVTGKILKQDLDRVIEEERVKVRFSVPKRTQVEFEIWLERLPGNPHDRDVIGAKVIERIGPVEGKKTFVPLKVNPPHSVDALRPLSEANLQLRIWARRNRQPAWGFSERSRTLSR